MTKPNPKVDEYLNNAAGFARPILAHLRQLIVQADPKIQETIKWGIPTFERAGNVCHIAAFKQHCSFVIQHAPLLSNQELLNSGTGSGMGQLGKITQLADLPADNILKSWVKQAVGFNLKGIKPTQFKKPKPALSMPDDFKDKLASKPDCKIIFDAFAPGYQRDYIEWISSAKTDKTRMKRMATALEWIQEGKHLNWKYEK